METQKILKTDGKIIVITDYRERETALHLENLGAKINVQNLEVGDFVVSDRTVIERKQHSDFVSSIIDGRIFEQAENMKKNFEKPVMIVEGSSNREINDNAFKGAISSLLLNFDLSIIHTRNPNDTARMIYWIAKKEQEDSKQTVSFKVGKKPPETKKLQEFVIASIPGISNVLAKRLLKHFGSVEKIINASEIELEKVDGIGNKLVKKIKKILTTKYK